MSRPRDDLSESILWSAVRNMVTELTTTGEIAVRTDPEYVVSYVCQELRAKGLVTPRALLPRDATPSE